MATPTVPRTPRQPGWRSLDILRAAALVSGLVLLLLLLWVAHDLIFITFLGILFGLAVARGADFLERFRVPRGMGVVLIVIAFLGVLVGLGAWAAPTLRAQSGELQAQLPQAFDRLEKWIESHRGGVIGQLMPPPPATPTAQIPVPGGPKTPGQPAPSQPPGEPPSPPQHGLPESLSGQLGALGRYLFSFLSSTVAVVGGLLLILFTAIYIGAEPDLYRKGLLHLFPHAARSRSGEVIGVATAIGLSLLGVKAALALGLIAGLLEFIPMLGPVLSAVPGIAMAFLDSPQKALFVALVYWGVQFLEGHILQPLLMKRGVDLPPVVTLIGLSLMAIVFGFLGMLVAVPVLAAVMVAIKMLYVEDVVGDDIQVMNSPDAPVSPAKPAHPAA